MKPIRLGSVAKWGIRQALGTDRGNRVIALIESNLLEKALQHVGL